MRQSDRERVDCHTRGRSFNRLMNRLKNQQSFVQSINQSTVNPPINQSVDYSVKRQSLLCLHTELCEITESNECSGPDCIVNARSWPGRCLRASRRPNGVRRWAVPSFRQFHHQTGSRHPHLRISSPGVR